MDHLIIGSPDSLKMGIRSETCVCVCVCLCHMVPCLLLRCWGLLSLGVTAGLVLSSADSLPLDASLPNESPSDGDNLTKTQFVRLKTHFFSVVIVKIRILCLTEINLR